MKKLINPFCISSVVLSFWANITTASAQVVPDNTLPINSQVTGCPVCLIDGGTVRGVNLFHSFEEFSVQTGGEAFFNNALDIQNIFGRVTGIKFSDIDGLIRAKGAANLFLINPNGIVFSENARLDIGGSFIGSTANAIGLGNQGIFSATEPEAPPLLTINPDALFFNQLAAQGVSSIEVRGSLSVPSGESLLLVGGNVAPQATTTGELLIDGGTLTAPGGRVELAGVGAVGEVGLAVEQGNWQLNVPADLTRTDIAILGSTIDVAGGGGGDIVIYAKDLTIGSSIVDNQPDLGETYLLHVSIENQAVGAQNPNQEAEPNNSINRAQNLDGSFSVAANPDVESSTTIPSVSISGTGDGTFDYYSFTVETAGSQGIFDIDQGDTGGAGSLDTELFLFDAQGGLLASNDDSDVTQGAEGSLTNKDSYISFNFETPGTYVIGVGKYDSNSRVSQLRAGIASGLGSMDAQSGDIIIDATGTVAVAEGLIRNQIQNQATGRGGDIKIAASSLSVTNGAQIYASTRGEGDAGEVVIRATDTVLLDGENSQGFGSAVFSEVESTATGNSGGVEIETGSLTLNNGARISASTFAEGHAGEVVIRATDSILFDGESSQGFGSAVYSEVNSIATGNSGGVEIETGSLTLNNGARISASNLGEGDAGEVVIRATDTVLLDGESSQGFGSAVYSEVNSIATGNSGGVEIETGSLTLNNGARISASTRAEGDAGKVVIRATDTILLDGESSQGFGSGVFSEVNSTATGNSGGVEIETGSLTLNNGARIYASTRAEGDAGKVVIRATDTVLLDGESSQGFGSGVFSEVDSTATGNSGGVEIETGSLTLNDGARIYASNLGEGDTGEVVIRATDSILFDGESSQGFGSAVYSEVNSTATGNSGGVEIETGSLSFFDGGQIYASSLGEGDAGEVVIRATDSILFDGESSQGFGSGVYSEVDSTATGNSGGVEIETGSLTLNNGARISAQTQSTVISGGVRINATEFIQLSGESAIRANATAAGSAGEVILNTQQLTLENKSQILVSNVFSQSEGITLEGLNTLTVNNSSIEASTEIGTAGSISINPGENPAASVTLNNSRLSTQANQAGGDASDITLNTSELTLSNHAEISASNIDSDFGANITLGGLQTLQLSDSQISTETQTGGAGTINVDAAESINLSGTFTSGNNTRGAGILAEATQGGSAGDVNIITGQMSIEDGAQVTVSSTDKGSAGNLTVNASDVLLSNQAQLAATTEAGIGGNVKLENLSSLLLSNDSEISASTETGRAGSLEVNASDVVLSNQARLTATTEAGEGGNISLQGLQTLQVSDSLISTSTKTGSAGSISVDARESINLSGTFTDETRGAGILAEATQGGTAGNLTVNTGRMTVRDGASVTVSSPQGQAGNLTIRANALWLDQGKLTAETGTRGVEEGANINLDNLDILVMTNESLISAEAFNDANGGNININSTYLLVLPPQGTEGSDIIARASRGNGGRITITGDGIFGIKERPAIPGNRTNDIDASSQFGNPGEITLNVSLDPSRGLTQLPSTLVDPSGQINRTCAASNRQSQFTVTGRGGLPENPTDLFSPDLVQDDFGTVIAREEDKEKEGQVDENNSPISHLPKQIIEAQGWIIDAQGNVVLTVYVPNGTPHGGWQNSVNCQVPERASQP